MANETLTSQFEWNHSKDLIFTEESLEEFIRLIKRGSIDGLAIYSIKNDLLIKNSNNTYSITNKIVDKETGKAEFSETRPITADKKNNTLYYFINNYNSYFVVVKKNIPLNETDEYQNIVTGRHTYIKAGDEIDLTVGDIFGTVKFIKNGSSTNVPVKGLDNFSNDNANKFLRGDGTWSNYLTGSVFAGSNDVNGDTIPFNTLSGNKQNGAVGPSGSIYFYSHPYINNSNGQLQDKRGIAGYNRSGTSTTLLYIDQDNKLHFPITINSSTHLPEQTYTYNLGDTNYYWKNIYGQTLYLSSIDDANAQPAIHGAIYVDGVKLNIQGIQPYSGDSSSTRYFWRGDNRWSNTLSDNIASGSDLTLKNTSLNYNTLTPRGKDASGTYLNYQYGRILFKGNDNENSSWIQAYKNHNDTDANERYTNGLQLAVRGQKKNSTNTAWENVSGGLLIVAGPPISGAVSGSYDSYNIRGNFGGAFKATKVFKAVFNDYAEYRQTIDLSAGHVVIDNDNGSLSCTTQRLQPGASIISDTFGDAMGYTEKCQTPLAIAGRVLVYTYQPRENYHAGMAVCSAPNGTVDIMTREEIREYPDCIIGIVSEIPSYETWGSENVQVNGRIWVKVK